jgi:Fe2+ transport protein
MLLLATSCVSTPGSSPSQTPAPSVTALAPLTPSTKSSATPNGSPTPVAAPATLEVSPAEVKVGNVAATLTFEAPRHLVDQTMFFNAPNIDPLQPTPVVPDGGSKGAIVLSDMLKVTNNMDPTQQVPADSMQAIIRHAMLRIKNGDGSAAVPYLGVSMDLLLDGRPLTFGQSLVPMVAAEATPPSLYYGNNVRLTQRGTYQVFVRLTRNALLGADQPQAAQFNLVVR